jgi:fatty-acyl-CoA synthase
MSLTNAEGKVGSVGRVPPFLAHRYPIALVRLDPVTEQPERGSDSLCIKCGFGEPGELVGRLDGARLRFDGYTSAEATEAKILRDVFREGDRWFRSGDLMKQDSAGFFYFIDRLGDTYRYKGENVSTTEVAAVVQSCDGVVDAIVYGVCVPGVEGKVGMAALVVDGGFSPDRLHAQLADRLPSYARPLFIRVCSSLEATATFRLRRNDFARQAYELAPDPVWFFDAAIGRYVPCDAEVIRSINARAIKL